MTFTIGTLDEPVATLCLLGVKTGVKERVVFVWCVRSFGGLPSLSCFLL